MTSKRWVTEEELTAADLNALAVIADAAAVDVVAAAELADAAQLAADTAQAAADAAQTTADAATVTADAAAADLAALADVASSGDYSDLANRPIDTNDGADTLEIIDDGMEVVARILADGTVALPGASFALAGTEIDAATITDATLPLANIAGTEASESDSAPAVEFTDDGGEIIVRIHPSGMQIPGADFSRDDGAAGLIILDDGMEVIARIDAAGASEGFGVGSVGSHSDDEIGWRNAKNLALAARVPATVETWVARPVWKYSHVVVYGQSLSIGAEGTPILSDTPKYGNLMTGGRVTATTNNLPGANNATPPTWPITGAAAFNGLEATASGDSETVIHGALNTFRRMQLAHLGLASDTARLLVGNSAGVGGNSIAAASKGASPELYNRVPSLVTQANAIAAGLSATYGVLGILWLQGESNQTTDQATYLAALRTLHADLDADLMGITGQADPPGFFTYQTTAPNSNFDTADLGVQMAQLTAALDDPGVFMVGPSYPYPDSNNLHLVANGYRWLGSQFGKVMHRVITLGHDWKPLHALRATRRGREILVDFHVPWPPLAFDDAYLQTGWTVGETATGEANSQYAAPDKGFRVISTADDVLTIDSIVLASETQVLITLEAEPSASLDLLVRIAGSASKGHASLRDSDPALADDIYLDGEPGQVDGEANATLSGERYPLWNWVVAQQIEVEA